MNFLDRLKQLLPRKKEEEPLGPTNEELPKDLEQFRVPSRELPKLAEAESLEMPASVEPIAMDPLPRPLEFKTPEFLKEKSEPKSRSITMDKLDVVLDKLETIDTRLKLIEQKIK